MSTAPRRPDLANEPVGRLMLRLSIPTITAQLVNMLYNLVDRIYISYIPDVGTLALTGLGVCLPIILLVSAFAALCASSGAPLASIAMGQRNNEKAEGILGSCTALLLCVSAVLTVILSCFYTPILLAFGATEDALPYAQRYIAIYSLGTVFVQLSLGLNPFITAQGFSKAGMLTVLIGAVLNTLLDPLFIFVFHMDVQGAALATVISQAVSAAFVLRFLTGRQTILHLKRRLLRLNWKLLAPCVALGNAKCSLFLACLRKLILLIPLVYLLPLFIPDTVFAIFLAEPIADILAVLCTVTLFSHVFRKTMRAIAA